MQTAAWPAGDEFKKCKTWMLSSHFSLHSFPHISHFKEIAIIASIYAKFWMVNLCL